MTNSKAGLSAEPQRLESAQARFEAQCRTEMGCRPEQVILGLDPETRQAISLADVVDPLSGVVDLATATGTGPNGQVTVADVRKVYATHESAGGLAGVRPTASVSSLRAVEEASAFTGRTVKIDPWARNPLVDDARQSDPLFYQAAMGEGPAPTLFKSGGDLPAFLASGSDPQILLKLPWVARHAAAKADSKKLFEMVEDLSGADGPDVAWAEATSKGYVDEAANREYFQRVNNWLHGADQDPHDPSPARLAAMDAAYNSTFPEEAQKRREQAAAEAEVAAKARYDADRKRIQNEVRTISAHRGYPV